MKQMEFTFKPDGKVDLRVTGVKGSSCSNLSEPFEKALGVVIDKERTADYYKAEESEVEYAVVSE